MASATNATPRDLKKLLEQRAGLDATIESLQREIRDQALQKAAQMLADVGLTVNDLIAVYHPRGKQTAKKPNGKRTAVKFRNAETGETWAGMGKRPKWLVQALESGKKLEDFQV